MARYVFDLETNGLLDTVTKIHSLVMINLGTGEMLSLSGPGGDIERGVKLLADAEEIIGHNVISFDVPVLRKLYGFETKGVVTDTMVLSRLAYPDLNDWDHKLFRKGKLPGNLIKTHKLKAWGYRLGLHKGDFEGPWDKWCPEMQTYCERDVELTKLLHEKMLAKIGNAPKAIAVEHASQSYCDEMQTNGVPFDERGAIKLWQELEAKRDALAAELGELFPPWIAPKKAKGTAVAYPKKSRRVKNKITGVRDEYEEGVPYSKIMLVEFNPRSRDHIANRLIAKYKWKPSDFSDTGKPTIDEKVLSKLKYPEAKPLAELLLLEKRIGQIADGKEAWLKAVQPDKRIHARYNPLGTVTGRATHSKPNISQVPKVGKPYGKECRALFHASPGYIMLGADLQGLELRCLGHYLSKWDGGLYAKEVVEGDPHTLNMKAMGLTLWFPDTKIARDKSKTETYAILYGSGDTHAGEIILGDPRAVNVELIDDDFEKTCRIIGGRIKKKWKKGIKGLGELIDTVGERVEEFGYVRAIDKRKIPTRSKHSALNALLQGTGAVLCKAWKTRARRCLEEEGLKQGVGKDYASLIWAHDEVQFEVKEELASAIGNIILRAARDTGVEYGFVPPLDAEFKTGKNWAETH